MNLFSRERRLTIALRLLVVCAGLGLLVAQVPTGVAHGPAHVGQALLIALAVNQASLFLTAARFQRMLAVFDLPTPALVVLTIHLQSIFYFFFVPMTVGLELSRFAKLKLHHPGASGTTLGAAILLDRFIGVAAAVFLTALCLPAVVLVKGAPIALHWPSLLLASAAAAAILGLALIWRPVRQQVYAVVSTIAPRWRRLGPAAALTVVSQVTFAYAAQQGAAAFGIELGFIVMLFAVSASMLFIIVPVSFAGAGPAEAACAALLVMLGLSAREALVASGVVYGLRLIAALQGGLLEAAGDLRGLRRLSSARDAAGEPPSA